MGSENLLDLFLAVIPKHGVNVPPLAMSYLSAAVKAAGFTCLSRDFNLDLWKKTLHSHEAIWRETNTTLFKEPEFSQFLDEFYLAEIRTWADEILAAKPRYIGISCFSYRSLPTMEILTLALKSKDPHCKIILGGAPISTYAERYVQKGIADFCVQSEGEVALVEILKGHFLYPGIVSKERPQTSPVQIENLDQLALPDYEQVHFDDYVPGDPSGLKVKAGSKNHRRQAGLMGSRGCVRGCSFCDVASYWPKFRYRSAENIFAEMKLLNEKHGVNEFYFHDSLVNGNLKELERLLDLLISVKDSMPVLLKGLAIVRNQPEAIYGKLRAAGFNQLQIGVESFSENVRNHMKKKFTNELLAENLRMYAMTGMNIVLLAMAGYPTETEADFAESLTWLEDHRHFIQNPVTRIDLGGTTLILPGAPLFKDNLTELFNDEEGNWVSFNGEEANTLALRKHRLYVMEEHCAKLGWNPGSSYAFKEHLIGDNEKDIIKERPQDGLTPLSHLDTGWVQDQSRKTIGFQA